MQATMTKKIAKVLVPKVHINEKINTRMGKKTLKTNVEWAILW